MSRARRLLRALPGRRLPTTSGTLKVPGVERPVRIHRDGHGIPHIQAGSDEDAAFAFGFCHGQDRAFQLEMLVRVVRGTLAELLGPPAVPMDRLSRRLGLRRDVPAVLALTHPHNRAWMAAYARGLNVAVSVGAPRPHELVLLRTRPTAWKTADVIGLERLLAFLMSTNWDQELVRLKVLDQDGPAAVAALDSPYPHEGPAHDLPGAPAGPVLDALLDDLRALADLLGVSGGSNAWALSPARTDSGRPLLAADPHLQPTMPPHWYLLHLRTPRWAVAGASFVGLPMVLAGHNGQGAWGPTIAPVDNTDLFLERIEGDLVHHDGTLVACARQEQVITVRDAEPVRIETVETPNGPVLTPDLGDDDRALSLRANRALSLRATWLAPHAFDCFDLHRAGTLDALRDAFRQWDGVPLNLVWADVSGTVGWQLVGRPPRRRRGGGTLPRPGWEPDAGWQDGPVPFERLPWVADPASGYVVSANHLPTAGPAGPGLGRDWLDAYRARRIEMLLDRRHDWDAAGCARIQRDVVSLVWWELRDHVLACPVTDDHAQAGRELLAAWGGRVAPDSAAATVFELLVAELTRRVFEATAPNAAEWAMGARVSALTPSNYFAKRRHSQLVRLIRSGDRGRLPRDWPAEIADALGTVVRHLRHRFGPDPAGWTWGRAHAWSVPHVLGARPPLDKLFDLGPLPGAGDHTTPAQHGVALADPLAPPTVHPSLRVVIDVGNWDASRFALPGGQSGNPASRHYDDQLEGYDDGVGVPICWSDKAVARATVATLCLRPG